MFHKNPLLYIFWYMGHQQLWTFYWHILITLTVNKQCGSDWYNVSVYFNYIQYIIFYTLYVLKTKAAIPQAVSCQLLTMMAQVRSQVSSYEICGGKSGTKSGFLWLLWLPMPIHIPLTAPYPLIILSLTSCHPESDSVIK